jgi:dTDP-4-dehydrorhamnose reductase
MRILLTGPTGQVGSALLDTLPSLGEVVPLERSELDLASADSIRMAVRSVAPEVIVNAAAYTAVDRAETEESLARLVNAEAPAVLAEEARRTGALLVHFSTDYVFDGEKPAPYLESDVTSPLNAYGRSKLAGEQAVQASRCRHLIFRTSWVYSTGGANFLLTMLRLAREGRPLRVVDDQHGAPTSSRMIATAVAEVLAKPGEHNGLYHMTAAGATTWHGFAQAIFEASGTNADLLPIFSSEYRCAARRPRNSVLDNGKLASHLQVRLPSWQDGMHQVLQALR